MYVRFLTLLFFFLPVLSAAETQSVQKETSSRPAMNSFDPYEDYNRAIYDFNMAFSDTIGEPVAEAYNSVLPDPVKTGISNFFNNLKEPINAINAFFQGNVEGGLTSFMRLSLNSTLGLFGLIDIATPAGLDYQKEDLGQTLYKWGMWSESSFIMMPIIGPYTTRELVGSSIDSLYNPTYPHLIQTDLQGRIMLFLGEKFVDYTQIVYLAREVRQQPDPYIFMRESYLQHRLNLIYNGNPPAPNLDDFNFE